MENIHTAHAHKIDFKEAFNYGWGVVKKHWGFLLLLMVLTFFITWPFSIFDNLWTDSWTDMAGPGASMWDGLSYVSTQEILWYVFYKFLTIVLSITLAYNTQKLYLKILHGQDVSARELFKFPTMNTLKYYVTMFIYVLMVMVGLIAFIIPGIYFYFKYFYATLLVLDKDLSIIEAGKRSAKMMEGNKWKMAEFLIMILVTSIGIILLGLICLLVGVVPAILIAAWIATFANLHVYKKLAN